MKPKISLKKIREERYWIILALFILSSFSYYAYYLKENQLFPKATLFFLQELKMPAKGERVLVFSPHPDDETIGTGGLITEAEKNGAEVEIALVTDGNKHGLKGKRYKEFKEATKILGVKNKDLIFLNYPDGGMQREDREKVKKVFENVIKKDDPNFIIFPYPNDQHLDHSTTGSIIEEIVKGDETKTKLEYLVHKSRFPYPHRFRPDDYILPPVPFVNYKQKWERIMLSEEIEDQKMEAILKYKTQLKYMAPRELLYSFVRKNEIYRLIK